MGLGFVVSRLQIFAGGPVRGMGEVIHLLGRPVIGFDRRRRRRRLAALSHRDASTALLQAIPTYKNIYSHRKTPPIVRPSYNITFIAYYHSKGKKNYIEKLLLLQNFILR